MATQGKYDFDYVPVDETRERPRLLKEGIPVGTMRIGPTNFRRQKCGECGKMNYDQTECVYCGAGFD